MVRPGVYKHWRQNSLLKHHTLLSVITFHRELFYPADIHPLAMFVKKGVPHPRQQGVLWLRALNDGLLKHKRKRLPNQRAKDDFAVLRSTLKAFVANPAHPVQEIDRFQRVAPIDFSDPMLELVPENYLGDSQADDAEIREAMIRVLKGAMSVLVSRGGANE
jgi:type I restriction-modification system DNA methylase subunit